MYFNPAIITWFGYSIVWGFFMVLALGIPEASTNFAGFIVSTFIMLWWAQLDAKKRDGHISSWLRWLVVVAGPIGLIVHFFRTRRILGALIAILVMVLLGLLSVIFAGAGAMAGMAACKAQLFHSHCRAGLIPG